MYIELFLLDNLLMDMLILRMACALCARPCVLWRAALFSSLGALYAWVALLFPLMQHWLGKCLCAGLLALGLPNGKNIRLYAQALLCVVLSAFLTGGMLFALVYAFCGSVDVLPLRWALAGACGAAYLPRLLHKRACVPPQRLCVAYGGQVYIFEAQLDTGNMLFEPVSGLPAIVAWAPALAPYAHIPVPTATVQGKGVLYALKPDAITLDGAPVSAILALSTQPLACAMIPAAAQPLIM
ncbi:MAG: sigma-E processing peptidase SpoIIGA [Clostridia bacterium]|nr:sigma-E processing peptidase SpoIIGA [Clostridia bacterium]